MYAGSANLGCALHTNAKLRMTAYGKAPLLLRRQVDYLEAHSRVINQGVHKTFPKHGGKVWKVFCVLLNFAKHIV